MTEFKSWKSYSIFANEVVRYNRFSHNHETESFLRALAESSNKRIKHIKTGSTFWRAQLGCNYRPFEENGEILFEEQVPSSEDRMIPVHNKAKDGRANVKGIPYLYLSTKRKTALSEVRPWVGSIVTLALFKTLRELKLVDCSIHGNTKIPYLLGEEPNSDIREEFVWKHIDNAFSRPVTQADDSAEYIPTQIIAEIFKNNGMDGLFYKSNFGTGLNIVLFDLTIAKFIKSCLFKTESIKLNFKECPTTIITYRRKKA